MNKDLQIELLKKDVSFKDKEIDRLEEENEKLKKQCKHRYEYARDIEGKYVIENLKIKAITKYLKDIEKEYGSLLDNEKIILKIATGDSNTIYDVLKGE